MAHPVIVPPGALPVTDADIARVETLLVALGRLLESGAVGGTDPQAATPALLLPNGTNTAEVVPYSFSGRSEAQLHYRQIALALATTLARFAGNADVGVTRLSTAPSTPSAPVALNAEEVSITPRAYAVPRADSNGSLDSWLQGSGSDIFLFRVEAACPADLAVGTAVYVSGAQAVAAADITDSAKMPAIGVVTEKPTTTSAVVQTAGVTAITGTTLTPGARYFVGTGGALTKTIPSSPGASLLLQELGVALSSNSLLLSGAMRMAQYWSP